MPRKPGRIVALAHRFRTEGDRTPAHQACAVGLGTFIGASPFIGFHLTMTLVLGRLFKLNRLKMYMAANISNPLVGPFLYALEIQVGAWLRTGSMYSPSRLDQVRLQGLAADILLGSLVVGAVLALIGGSLTYWAVSGHGEEPAVRELIEAAAEPYLAAGMMVWEIARGKLRMDPVYLRVLADGVLPAEGRFIDIGCGQGLMLSLLATARDRSKRGLWPGSWPPAPAGVDLVGIEMRPRIAQQAREVLDGVAVIEERDVTTGGVPACQAVLLVDVLHLMSRASQDRLIADIARALGPAGRLVVREADAAGGWRFHMVRVGNRINAIVQGRFSRRFHFDSAVGWQARLVRSGFRVDRILPQDGGPFANVLLYATRA